MRHLVVHHHLFKNAGSTVDHVLARHFGPAWGTIESGSPGGLLEAAAFADFVRANPSLRAISSHQLRPPAPGIDGVQVHPILFLRDPVDRAASVHAFERTQPPDISPGAAMAARCDLPAYIDWRLEQGDGGVICDFQTMFLGWEPGDETMAPALGRAMRRVDSTPGVGLVERFEASMARIAAVLAPVFGPIDVSAPAMNRNPRRAERIEERISAFREALGPARYERLRERNQLDLALHAHALAGFEAKAGAQAVAPTPAER